MRPTIPLIVLAPILHAQLIPAGQPLPRKAKPPVVFLNGYQPFCSETPFATNFGKFDQLFQATGRVTAFFDNCTLNGKPPIEQVASAFAAFLSALRYDDNTSVDQVDIVAHSMGGNVVRSYLAGKQTGGGFLPPARHGIRKIVFIATPHWGGPYSGDVQQMELASGSPFIFDLATWNQGTDDLRGIDSLALAGNAGTGRVSATAFDDGSVLLSSASIGFAQPGKTRILPYCHTANGLITLEGNCAPGAPGIAQGLNASDPNAAAVLSFLNDTDDWKSIGQAAEQNQFLGTGGTLQVRARTSNDQSLTIQKATSTSKDLNISSDSIAWTELIAAQKQALMLTTPSGTVQSSVTVLPASGIALTAKDGPTISRVFPAASAVYPLAIAPGTFASIYGTNLAAAPTPAPSGPFPLSLGGVQVTIGGVPIPLQFVSQGQINAVIPDTVSGLVVLTVMNSSGRHSVNVLIEPSVPAIFTQNQSGSGPAAALNGITNVLVTPANPLHSGDYVSLYLTGLGATTQPDVVVGGKACAVTFAGPAPGYPGLDQINCQLAAGTAPGDSTPVVVTASGRSSNVVTLAVR
jgi:uncharacterized protein (TIGR03437 family)